MVCHHRYRFLHRLVIDILMNAKSVQYLCNLKQTPIKHLHDCEIRMALPIPKVHPMPCLPSCLLRVIPFPSQAPSVQPRYRWTRKRGLILIIRFTLKVHESNLETAHITQTEMQENMRARLRELPPRRQRESEGGIHAT